MAYRTEIEKLEQRYAENPKQWFAALADAYRKQGDVDLAIEYVQGGIKDRPDYASAHIVLGRCYLDKDLDDDAARAFEQVLDLDAENIIALKSLEEIAERKGDIGGARQWLTRLLEVDPMNEEAHAHLARLNAEETADEPAPEAEAAAPEAPASIEPMMLDATMPLDAESAAAEEETTAEIEPVEIEMEETAAAIEPVEIETADTDAISLHLDVPGDVELAVGDEETAAEIEPFEIETEDSDAISLLAASAAETDSESVDEAPVAAIGSIELDTPDADASSLLAGMPEESESSGAFEKTVAEIGPIELDTPGADASSLLADSPDETEPVVAFGETVAEVEPVELDMAEDEETGDEAEAVADPVDTEIADATDEESAQRLSVPPTKEVDAVDIEALRAADEMVVRPTVDAAVVDEEELEAPVETIAEPDEGFVEEAPRTTEIDAVELEKLRMADALVAGSTVEALLPDGGEEEAESVDEVEEPEGDGESELKAEESIDDEALPLIMPDDVGGTEATPDAEPEPVVTETMAEVYARQGLFEQAREIYEVLVMQHADDSRLKARLDELNAQANSAIQETRQSRFSVAVTGGESTVTYLQRIFRFDGEVAAEVHATDIATAAPEAPPVSEPEMAPTPLEEAFADDPPEAPGEPTVVAADDVNLASVFDGGVAEPASTELVPDESDQAADEPGNADGVSFDEFYGSEPPQSLPEANGSPSDDEPSDDDDNFKDWLKGLKT